MSQIAQIRSLYMAFSRLSANIKDSFWYRISSAKSMPGVWKMVSQPIWDGDTPHYLTMIKYFTYFWFCLRAKQKLEKRRTMALAHEGFCQHGLDQTRILRVLRWTCTQIVFCILKYQAKQPWRCSLERWCYPCVCLAGLMLASQPRVPNMRQGFERVFQKRRVDASMFFPFETSRRTKLRVVRWAVCQSNRQPRTTTLAAPYRAHNTSSEWKWRSARADHPFIDKQTLPNLN